MNYKISVKKLIICFLTLMITVSFFSAVSLNTQAAFSGGSGTQADPYLIKTADDLYNMRDNLSACYKLAATIDMKGYKTDSKFFKNGFVPIGDDSTKPFTGSFTCDLGSDGLPLYAILNLKIYNAKGDLFNHDWYGESDYPDAFGQPAPYYWETGLFGTTDGAYIANIYLLNVDIYSSVVGQNNGRYKNNSDPSSLVSYKAFADEQATGALIAAAVNTDIYHCAVTGKVDGKTNMHGGMLGRAVSSTVSSCYTNVKLSTGGCWSVGGFVGRISNGTVIKECASYGTVDAELTGYGKMLSAGRAGGKGLGGFVGTIINSTITDSFSAADLSKNSNSNYGFGFFGVNDDTTSVISNCYSCGDFKGKTTTAKGGENSTCFVSSENTCLQLQFAAKPMKEIKEYFSKQSLWDASGKIPVLKSVTIVEDASIFSSGKNRGEASNNNATSSNTTSNNTTSNSPSNITTSSNNGTNSGNAPSNSTTSNTTSNNTTSGNANSNAITSGVTSGNNVTNGNVAGNNDTASNDTATNNTINSDNNITNEVVPGNNQTSSGIADNNLVGDNITTQENTQTTETVETREETDDVKNDIVHLVLIGILSIMIVGIGCLSVVIAINTLNEGKKIRAKALAEEEEENEE